MWVGEKNPIDQPVKDIVVEMNGTFHCRQGLVHDLWPRSCQKLLSTGGFTRMIRSAIRHSGVLPAHFPIVGGSEIQESKTESQIHAICGIFKPSLCKRGSGTPCICSHFQSVVQGTLRGGPV